MKNYLNTFRLLFFLIFNLIHIVFNMSYTEYTYNKINYINQIIFFYYKMHVVIWYKCIKVK